MSGGEKEQWFQYRVEKFFKELCRRKSILTKLAGARLRSSRYLAIV
jgi:hypothetical protein